MSATFWSIAVLMLLGTLALVLRPLMHRGGDERTRKLAALAAAREAGVLDEAEFAAKRDALLAADASTPPARGVPMPLVLAIALLVPLAAIGLYMWKGTPVALDPASHARRAPPAGDAASAPEMEKAIAGLAERMKGTPDDLEGWVLLARAYKSTERFAEAREAFAKALALAPENAEIMVEYAEAIALATPDRALAGEARALLERALASNPDHQRGLWLMGISEAQIGAYPAAVAAWERLLPALPSDSEVAKQVAIQIAEARLRAGMPQSTVVAGPARGTAATPTQVAQAAEPAAEASAPDGARLVVQIDIAPELRAKLGAGDTLYVFARAPQGPKMPLAIQRIAGAKFPLTVTLDDTMGMTPQMKLSSASEVVVGARVSKSGVANAQSGDFETISAPLVLAEQFGPVSLTIDRIVP